jgi:hypothetical protein
MAMIETEKPLPSHLISMPGMEWAFWRTVVLRGAGFPVSLILDMDTKECAAAAERVLDAEQNVTRARQEVLDAINADTGWSDAGRRRTLLKAVSSLQKGNTPKNIPDGTIGEAARKLQAALKDLESALLVYNNLFYTTEERITRNLFEVAVNEAFNEAIVWQNPLLMETGLQQIQTAGQEELSRISPGHLRQRKRLVANYLQRYSLKNDTIGFFGPVGWAQISSFPAHIAFRPGASLLASRRTYFEAWGIDLLAERLATDDVLPWLMPRRLPYISVDGDMLRVPMTLPFKIPVSHAMALQACDGTQTARDLAAKLCRDPLSGLTSEDQVYAVLHELRRTKRIAWTLEIPFGASPEAKLREAILRNGNENFRRKALAALDEFESAKDKVAHATGNSSKLTQAISDLNETFTQLTGRSSNRKAGEMYAARTLVYEDCRRDIELEIGEQLLAALGTPLSLILTSARWLAFEMGRTFEQVSDGIYERLVERFGSQQVDLINFWFLSQDMLFNKETSPLLDLIAQLQARWKDILHIPDDQKRVQYNSKDLQLQVDEVFKASFPGWVSACFHSPDVMIAATSLDAICRDEYLLVLGELHACSNAIATEVFLSQHPHLSEVINTLEVDYAARRVAAAVPRAWQPLRTRPLLVCPNGYRIVFGYDTCEPPAPNLLAIGELVVEKQDGKLWVRSRDGLLKFSLLDVFEDALSAWVVHEFDIITAQSHVPRITIDRLVIHRESWRFALSEIPFALQNETELFLSFRRWVHTHALPRFAFYRTPLEQKPIFVDFNNPVYVDIFAKNVRKVSESDLKDAVISLTEMLPSPEEAWLPDKDGHHYTSEFRIVIADRIINGEAS